MNIENLSYVAIALGALGLLFGLFSLLRTSKLRRQFFVFRGETSDTDVLTSVLEHINRVNDLDISVSKLSNSLMLAQRDVAVALRHVAVVRFNAIQEMGGQYSFCLALLDDDGTGIVITCLQNQATSRVFAKPVVNRTSDIPLSPEELQAISSAKPLGERS
ncbi:MAG: DUF4446 family protein [Candidatus Nanopelagicales bacterium]